MNNKYVWFKGVAQATVYDSKEVAHKVNAPLGFVEVYNDDNEIVNVTAWKEAVEAVAGKSFTSIRTLEQAYLYADNLCKWRTSDDKAGVAMSSECANIRSYLVKCEETGKEIDNNVLRPLLTAWLVSCFNASAVKLDASVITVTGKRADDFVKRMGKDVNKSRVPKSGKLVTGNRETVTKSGSAFMRELCRWTQSVTQMKYNTVVRLTVA